ncbi:hypothetical protein JB92DRAFT_2834448 [Gautieria morchelliformis]|nr:hypothetical protein JB92DRAFT_2834448 [Gautieria morchelliformis]
MVQWIQASQPRSQERVMRDHMPKWLGSKVTVMRDLYVHRYAKTQTQGIQLIVPDIRDGFGKSLSNVFMEYRNDTSIYSSWVHEDKYLSYHDILPNSTALIALVYSASAFITILSESPSLAVLIVARCVQGFLSMTAPIIQAGHSLCGYHGGVLKVYLLFLDGILARTFWPRETPRWLIKNGFQIEGGNATPENSLNGINWRLSFIPENLTWACFDEAEDLLYFGIPTIICVLGAVPNMLLIQWMTKLTSIPAANINVSQSHMQHPSRCWSFVGFVIISFFLVLMVIPEMAHLTLEELGEVSGDTVAKGDTVTWTLLLVKEACRQHVYSNFPFASCHRVVADELVSICAMTESTIADGREMGFQAAPESAVKQQRTAVQFRATDARIRAGNFYVYTVLAVAHSGRRHMSNFLIAFERDGGYTAWQLHDPPSGAIYICSFRHCVPLYLQLTSFGSTNIIVGAVHTLLSRGIFHPTAPERRSLRDGLSYIHGIPCISSAVTGAVPNRAVGYEPYDLSKPVDPIPQ